MIESIVSALSAACEKHGFKYFTRGEYNLNLIGIRSPVRRSGLFDDTLSLTYREAGIWRCHLSPFTSDPGTKYLSKPINKDGAAVLCSPQQILGGYRLGQHRGREALVQAAPFEVWRDNNLDGEIDKTGPRHPGWYGINLHDTPYSSNYAASAGCQVVQYAEFLKTLLGLVERTGGRVSYTLIDEGDLGL